MTLQGQEAHSMHYDYSRQPVHHPDTAVHVLGSDLVIVSAAEKRARSLDPVGSRIWELADGRRSIHDIAVYLTQEFDLNLDTARLCAITFIETLVDGELLTWR